MKKIDSGKAIIGVVGLGYVGLPTSVLFAKKFRVVGYDVDRRLIRELTHGVTRIEDVPRSALVACLGNSFFPTTKEKDLDGCDVFVICVPAYLAANRVPNLEALRRASATVRRHLRKDSLVLLQTTTFPGTTDSILVPILEERGLKAGRDFFVAYSPERIDPGRKEIDLEDIPKIVGGYDQRSAVLASNFLQSSFHKVVPVRDCKTAEATKMFENIFRAANIALVNELTLALEKMKIDVWEVIEAASTKPFGFTAFWPGPGIGGHCIPLDPYYFSYAAKRVGVPTRFIKLSGQVNASMPYHVLELLEDALETAGKTLRGSRIAILGLAYKRDVSDTRESPTVKVIEEVVKRGGTISAYDPFAKRIQTRFGSFSSAASVKSALREADAAVLLVDHSAFRKLPVTIFRNLVKRNPIVVDCRNVLARPPPNTVYVGLGKRATIPEVEASTAV